MINFYLKSKYKRGARGPLEFDCWGLVRTARTEIFCKPLLPLLTDAEPGNLREIHRAFNQLSASMEKWIRPVPGSIAVGFRGNLAAHVGLVVESDGRTWILETDVEIGPALTRPSVFEARFTSVEYYND